MKTVKGNLIDMAFAGDFDIIIQGCNCQCRMKSGIAKEIAERIPEAVEADNRTVTGDPSKLGNFSVAYVDHAGGCPTFFVVNAYTQVYWGTDSVKVDYPAVMKVFKELARNIWALPNGDSVKIGYPKIGCGLAGGSWKMISKIVDEELSGLDHTYVEFEG